MGAIVRRSSAKPVLVTSITLALRLRPVARLTVTGLTKEPSLWLCIRAPAKSG